MRHSNGGNGGDSNDSDTAWRTRFTRRVLLGGATATAAGAILAACGGNPDAVPTATGGAATAVTGAGTTAGGTANTAAPAAPAAPTMAAPRPPTSTPQAMTTMTGDEMPVRGGRLVIADSQGDAPLDPFKTTWHSTAQFAVFTRYVEKAPDLKFIPHSFESWQASPDSKDVTFKVKPGITFTDGTPLDAAAIKFNLDRFIDPMRKSPGGSAFGPVKSVEMVDAMTVRLRFDAPYAPLYEGLSGREIASPAAVMKYGEDFTNNPVGAGPFIVKKQVPGNSIEYDRNPDYAWAPAFYKNRGAAYLDGMTIRAIKEDATTWAALQAGEVHLGSIPTIYIKEAEMNPNITVHKRLDSGIRYLGFNCQKPPFNDQRVRQAISHAIDRPSIVANALDGYGDVLYTPMASAIAYSDNAGMEKIAYKFDPMEAAKAKTARGGLRHCRPAPSPRKTGSRSRRRSS